jgi:hypothetical protein
LGSTKDELTRASVKRFASRGKLRYLVAVPQIGDSVFNTVHVPDRPQASTSSISMDDDFEMGPKIPRDGSSS